MRKQLLTVLLPLLVMVLIAASAQTQSAGTDAPKHAALQKVNVVRTGDGFSVEISARGAVKPRLSTLDSPARIVVDLPNTVVATSRGQHQRGRRRRQGRAARHGRPGRFPRRGRSDQGVPSRTGGGQRQHAGPEALHQVRGCPGVAAGSGQGPGRAARRRQELKSPLLLWSPSSPLRPRKPS